MPIEGRWGRSRAAGPVAVLTLELELALELAEACGLWPRWRPWLRGVPKAVLQVGEATESCQSAQQSK